MLRIIVFLSGVALLALSVVCALNTREFIRTAQPAEGKRGRGDVTTDGKKGTGAFIEFWIKNEGYQPAADPSFYSGLSPEIVMLMSKSHTRYRFRTYSVMIGASGSDENIPVLYNPESLKHGKASPMHTELDSGDAVVNTFTSLYAYSIMFFVPAIVLSGGVLLGFLKAKYGSRRYLDPEKEVRVVQGRVRCAGCGTRFSVKDRHRWDGERHRSCGQKLRLVPY